MTNSTHVSLAAPLLPAEGHSSLFFSSDQASTASLSRPGLPRELFLLVMHYLNERVLVRCSHVCRNWRQTIVGCKTLWTELEGVEVATVEALDRVRAVASRSKGALRTLTLYFHHHFDLDQPVTRLRQILREITVLDGARNLRHLKLDLFPFRFSEDRGSAFDCVFVEFSAVNLETLKIVTELDRFPAGAPFLYRLPSLKKLLISSDWSEPIAGTRLPDFFGNQALIESAQATTSELITLVLAGPSLRNPTFPAFPHLRTLKLYDTHVSNLYGLLANCASTLEVLWLRGVTADPPSNYLLQVPGAAQKDIPPVLLFSRLTNAQICGQDVPLLWLKATNTPSSFCADTPVLRKVSFSGQQHLDPHYSDEGNIEPVDALSGEALSNLFRNSPELEAVDLTDTDVDAAILVASLPLASSTLTHLNIGGTLAACDAVIDHLHYLAPQLNWLGTYSDEWEGASGTAADARHVSVQALARFARAMKKSWPLRWRKPDWHLRLVAHEPVDGDIPSSELKDTLCNHLVTLSPSQLSYLTSSLTLNTPPARHGVAATLSLSYLKSRIHSLASPPSLPSSFPTKPGEPGYNTTALTGKKPHAAPAVAATPQEVIAAKDAMQAWVTRREEAAAIEWCDRATGVELVWGHALDWECWCEECEFWRGDESDDK